MHQASPQAVDSLVVAVRDGYDSAVVSGSYQGLIPDEREPWRRHLAEQACESAQGDAALGTPIAGVSAGAAILDEAKRLAARVADDGFRRANDCQHYALIYIAMQLRLRAIDDETAEQAVRRCWGFGSGRKAWIQPEAQVDALDTFEEWPIVRPVPDHVSGWIDEITAALLVTDQPLKRVVSESAVGLALRNRGIDASADSIAGLVGVIRAMERELIAEDPHWRKLEAQPAMGFALSYVWTHLGIGAIGSDRASEILAACSERLGK